MPNMSYDFQSPLDPKRPNLTREELLAEQVIALRMENQGLRAQLDLLQARLDQMDSKVKVIEA
jgi:hypothetical protein